ncbi:MAG: hypothetical protein IT385_21910 [Deltaproteobacteria bacterium]|nr:hypothetical protein [Deltaproteobacteria bacterium]
MCRRLCLALVVASVAAGCPSTPAVVEPDPGPIVEPDPEDEEDEVERAPEQSSLDGDLKISDRWRPRFREWAAQDIGGVYDRVLDVQEDAGGATVVLMRHLSFDDQCREGPTTLRITETDGETGFETDHWGDDCCPGIPCVIDLPIQWNLRYITAVHAHDRAGLAKLLPAKGKLTWKITSPDGQKTHTLVAKDVLAGKLDNAAGCSLTSGRAECTVISAADPTGAFQCTCVAPGSSATFAWKKEGAGWVLVSIDESSH